MRKQFSNLILLLMAVPLLLISCAKNETGDKPVVPNGAEDSQFKTDIIYCGSPVVAPMIDFEQTMSPATISIGNDQTSLLIKYQLDNPEWYIYHAALFVGTEEQLLTGGTSGPYAESINPDGTGHFFPWRFPLQSYHSATANVNYKEYLFDLTTLPECFIVVAQIQIRNAAGERAYLWGKSALKTPGFYINYCVQECPPPPPPPPLGGCETGYAYGLSYANCFLTIPGVNSNNWGWSNGLLGPGNYTWPMYAGAGQCNIGNGINVGTLTVNYTPPTATVTYTVLDGYVLNATHLYVGNRILPMKNGRYTTAPGQFPYKHENLNGVSTDTYTITGLSGSIYVAAHSEVCDDI